MSVDITSAWAAVVSSPVQCVHSMCPLAQRALDEYRLVHAARPSLHDNIQKTAPADPPPPQCRWRATRHYWCQSRGTGGRRTAACGHLGCCHTSRGCHSATYASTHTHCTVAGTVSEWAEHSIRWRHTQPTNHATRRSFTVDNRLCASATVCCMSPLTHETHQFL